MTDVASGLVIDASDEVDNVDSDAGFTKALAGLVGKEISPERLEELRETDTSVSDEMQRSESKPEDNRDADGRFKPATTPEKPAEGVAPVEGDEVQADPELAALLEKHEGDATKALAELLKQNTEAQSLIGRQANEVGDVRTQLAELKGRLDGIAQSTSQAQLPVVGTEQINEAVFDRGLQSVVSELVNAGYPDGHPTYDAAFTAAISQDDTGQANAAYTRYLVALSQQANAPAVEVDTKPDPVREWAEQKQAQESVDKAIEGISAEFPKEQWDLIAEQLEPALKDDKTPQIIKDAVASEDPTILAQGLQALAQLAHGRAIAVAANSETNKTKKVAEKQAAGLATGSLRPVSERQPEPGAEMSKEEATQAFYDRLLKTETTSVSEGWTGLPSS